MSSASKQKRQAKKAAKSATNSGAATPIGNGSTAGLEANLAKLKVSERTATGVLTSEERSRDIKIESFSLYFHGRQLINNANIELNHGRRYGLIGANGSGKSTFLECLAAREVPIPDHIDIYLLNEEAPPSDMNAVEFVKSEAEKEIKRLEQRIEDILAEEGGADDSRLEDLYERIESFDPSSFESRAASLLHGLGFTAKQMKKVTSDLSGGWRMRVALARALFVKPTLLLLDEPTNHLDLEACVWLEMVLRNYEKTLVLVSHSQDFLNGVCTNTIDLTHQKKLNYYGGNYDTFIKTRQENEINQNKAFEKQQAEIEHIKKFISSAGTYANLVKQAKSKQKIIDKMEAAGLVEKVEPPPLFKFTFGDTTKLPPPVLSFEDVSFSYNGKKEDYLYEELDLAVDMDSRIALVGPNGVGKSTLLKMMSGELNPCEGRVQRHMHLKLAKYSQHSADQLDMDATPIEYMRRRFPDIPGEMDYWRQRLGRYGISGGHQIAKISTLSDGLKSRIVFAEIALAAPGIILLDEPTNHLDMESIDALAVAIRAYEGGVVLVSHDFRLISQIAEQIWLCENKTVTEWQGTIQDYKKSLQKKVKV